MKRVYGLLLVLALVMLAGCGLVSTGESAAEKATEIATFDIPAGYTPDVGMDLAGTVMVGYSNAAENGHIYLIQAPASSNLSQAQLEQSLRDALNSSQDATVDTVDLEEMAMTIRGEEVTATVGTATGQNDTTMRVLTVPFTGNGGPALLLIQTAEASWDQATIDDFIASFR
ncbi:MAG TPA: hypothetical protein PK829_12340 [Promineifilum sp.]|nr:hypothetical protein [Promineifilum sp.]